MRRPLTLLATAGVTGLLATSCAPSVRFNQGQVIGTHNSYHLVRMNRC